MVRGRRSGGDWVLAVFGAVVLVLVSLIVGLIMVVWFFHRLEGWLS